MNIFFYCCDILKSESPDTSIIAAGDFNPVSNGFNPRVINSQCNLKQVVKHPTRNSVILDLIMSDIHKFYEEPLVLAPIDGSDPISFPEPAIPWEGNGGSGIIRDRHTKNCMSPALRMRWK